MEHASRHAEEFWPKEISSVETKRPQAEAEGVSRKNGFGNA
jgi:hypothetical protein